jgi:hypothetical protein
VPTLGCLLSRECISAVVTCGEEVEILESQSMKYVMEANSRKIYDYNT